MAVWETTVLTGAIWVSDGGPFGVPDGSLHRDNGRILKIDDKKAGQTTFEVNETVSLTFGNGVTVNNGTYLGTVTVDGATYPVVHWNTFWYAVGLDRSAPGVPETLAANDIDASTFTVCFFPGTLIATPYGERKVEELVSGDPVLAGDSRVVPVKWIGRQTVSTIFGPAERLMPVRFAAGSLGEGKPLLPHSDLTVTADHAMLVDGVLCEAGTLVNETTINRVPLSEFGDSYTVYHVETEAHEIVLANGAPSETFVDNVSRRAFDNFAEFELLHGDPPEMNELPYPRASNARHLPARIKNRLGIGAGKESAA